MGSAGDTVSQGGLPDTMPLRLAAPVPPPAARAAARHDLAARARQLPRHLAGPAGRLVLTAGLPAADLLALAAAAALAGAWLLPAAGYAACVLVILAATGQH
ncbi:MAG TPA: hypothetical protein VE343_15190, partial [Streptosporangiaceae bacterium]|nr:hypothetical protein [Streptosporangiaceae bacterium]